MNSRFLGLVFVLICLVAGCVFETGGISGGTTSSSSSGGDSSSSAGGGGGSGGGSTTNTGGGGSTGCTNNSECGTDTTCQHFNCDVPSGMCSAVPAPQGTDCSKEVAGGTCDSGGTCAKCDGTAPNSFALLNAGDNVGKTIEVLHLSGGSVVQANSTQDSAPSAKFSVCASPIKSGDKYAIYVRVNAGNAIVDLTHTAAVKNGIGLTCFDDVDLGGMNPSQAQLLAKVNAGPAATIFPALVNPVVLNGNCAAKQVALYIVDAQ